MNVFKTNILKLIAGMMLIIPAISSSQNWIGVSSGLNNTIEHLFSDTINSRLYASGKFSDTACHNAACYSFAYWDNTSWHYCGDSTQQNNRIPLTYFNGKMVSANFNLKYGAPINTYCYIGEFNGNHWIRTDSSDGIIRNLRVINTKLYALGSFNKINGVSAQNIAYKDAFGWHAVDTTTWNGSGMNDAVEFNGSLYVCGWFTNYNGTINRLAKWNGLSWSSVGGAMFTNTWTVPFCLCTYKNELYLSGYYIFKSNGDPGDGICKWNDTTWSELGLGLLDSLGGSAGANEMEVINNKLVIAGAFDFADRVPAKNIVEWDGTKFCAFGEWFDNAIDHIAFYNNQIFASGPWHADTINVFPICRWVGGNYRDSCGSNLVGINQLQQDNFLKIYPNPVSEGLFLEIEGLSDYESALIIIQNTLGEIVYHGKFSKSIALNDLSSGCYFLQVIPRSGGVYKSKFIKQ